MMIAHLSTILVCLHWQRSYCNGCFCSVIDGNCYFNPEKVHTPSQLQEIQDIVKKANEAHRKIKVLGTGHSRSAIALSEDLYLSLHNYRGLVDIDVARKLATFRGGTRLWEILRILDSYNLTLPILPAIGDQTISGALVTGKSTK